MIYGPTKPLQPAPPTPRDIVESEHISSFLQHHSVVSSHPTAQVLSYVESVAHVMVTLCNLKRQQHQQQLHLQSSTRPEHEANGDSSEGVLHPPPLMGGETFPVWAKAFAFGSAGLEANVAHSDIDVYVGRVPNTMLPKPLQYPALDPSLRFHK